MPALGHKSCVVVPCSDFARVVSRSDFRLASHVSHSRTERHLSLASQHAVAANVVCKKVVTIGSNDCVRDVATKPPEKKTATARARSP